MDCKSIIRGFESHRRLSCRQEWFFLRWSLCTGHYQQFRRFSHHAENKLQQAAVTDPLPALPSKTGINLLSEFFRSCPRAHRSARAPRCAAENPEFPHSLFMLHSVQRSLQATWNQPHLSLQNLSPPLQLRPVPRNARKHPTQCLQPQQDQHVLGWKPMNGL